ncbi:MAG: zf-HC2 domain-containing protein [Candidatus Brocadiae bacterium]|nr:zf-HC2 domain-containing protein [Candidatus Brocadiia bacterium]
MADDDHMEACERQWQLVLYHDGELAAAGRQEFEEHLSGCPECARDLLELEAVSRLIRGADAPPVPVGMVERLQRSVPTVPDLVILQICRPVAAAAAVLLVVCGALMAASGSRAAADRPAPAAWEVAAVALDVELEQAGPQETLALWTLQDLSRGNGS